MALEKPPKQTLAQKLAIIDRISATINDKAGRKLVGRIGKDPEIADKLKLKFISSKCADFNEAVGGGYPRARCTIISGLSDSGKTGRLLEDIGYNMQTDHEFTAVWVESEKSIELSYVCDTFHIDPERFVYIEYDQNQGGEGILDILYGLMSAVQFDMVCINSLKCLVPTKIIEETMDSQTPALAARLNSRMVQKFLALVANNDTAFVLVTHTYTSIGAYGAPQVVAGGNAIRYWSALSLSFSRKTVTDADPITKEQGVHISVTVQKNHCLLTTFPYRKFDYYAIFGEGTDIIFPSLQRFIDKGIMEYGAGGSWKVFDENGEVFSSGRGKTKYYEYMKENPEVFESLLKRLDAPISTVQEMTEEEVTAAKEEELEQRAAAEEVGTETKAKKKK